MIFKELRMEGFIVSRWSNRREEGLNALLKWVVEVRKEGVVFCKVYSYYSFPLCKGSLVTAVEVRSQRSTSFHLTWSLSLLGIVKPQWTCLIPSALLTPAILACGLRYIPGYMQAFKKDASRVIQNISLAMKSFISRVIHLFLIQKPPFICSMSKGCHCSVVLKLLARMDVFMELGAGLQRGLKGNFLDFIFLNGGWV